MKIFLKLFIWLICSLIASGIFMYLLDYTVNMITLFALIVAVGMVVDNAIVVLGNMARHWE